MDNRGIPKMYFSIKSTLCSVYVHICCLVMHSQFEYLYLILIKLIINWCLKISIKKFCSFYETALTLTGKIPTGIMSRKSSDCCLTANSQILWSKKVIAVKSVKNIHEQTTSNCAFSLIFPRVHYLILITTWMNATNEMNPINWS